MGMAGHRPSPLTSSHGADVAPTQRDSQSVIPLQRQHQAPLPSASNTPPISYLPLFLLLPSPVSFGNSLEPGEALSGQDGPSRLNPSHYGASNLSSPGMGMLPR